MKKMAAVRHNSPGADGACIISAHSGGPSSKTSMQHREHPNCGDPAKRQHHAKHTSEKKLLALWSFPA